MVFTSRVCVYILLDEVYVRVLVELPVKCTNITVNLDVNGSQLAKMKKECS